MTITSRVEGCLVRKPVEWVQLARALGEILALDPVGIRAFDADHLIDPPPPALVEIHEHKSGFRLDLTFYLRIEARPETTGVQLARRLAMVLGQEVLTSPPAMDDGAAPAPDRWVLARPDGSLFLVRQLFPESDDIEIDYDPHQMERLLRRE
ncbi:hypothetical protein [Vitiosangium sp. GDMCC 1.1324]|uniref:hypothetical protein n=1 Tax=Vitiosangium sp. (strain GDMCC 1.1324) TaxID=2138576 RepID=UPI000D3D2E1A|nr:hypothetical protein [Vitiosangium sp. GDMCC 1.1324]PTL83828.1 hypothetical protein DAT35_10190 [Vitiosangium sp. GDMCC 1.1324]